MVLPRYRNTASGKYAEHPSRLRQLWSCQTSALIQAVDSGGHLFQYLNDHALITGMLGGASQMRDNMGDRRSPPAIERFQQHILVRQTFIFPALELLLQSCASGQHPLQKTFERLFRKWKVRDTWRNADAGTQRL